MLLLIVSNINAESKEEYCSKYADKAFSQHVSNVAYQCNFQGFRWSSDESGQKEWCLSVSKAVAEKEISIRDSLLAPCSKNARKKWKIERKALNNAFMTFKKNNPKYSDYIMVTKGDEYNSCMSTRGIPNLTTQDDFGKNILFFIAKKGANCLNDISLVVLRAVHKKQRVLLINSTIANNWSYVEGSNNKITFTDSDRLSDNTAEGDIDVFKTLELGVRDNGLVINKVEYSSSGWEIDSGLAYPTSRKYDLTNLKYHESGTKALFPNVKDNLEHFEYYISEGYLKIKNGEIFFTNNLDSDINSIESIIRKNTIKVEVK